MFCLLLLIASSAVASPTTGFRRLSDGSSSEYLSLSLNREEISHYSAPRLTSRHNQRKLVSNQLEEVDLFIGTGTHYANLYIGSPPQRTSVIIDTGSPNTAFPCTECVGCGDHTDPYFNPSESSTSRQLTCSDCSAPQLRGSFKDWDPSTGRCDRQADTCTLGQSYAEGSSWNAVQFKDKVWLGRHETQENSKAHLQLAETEFKFGCINRQAGMFSSQVSNGITGFGRASSTLVTQLHDSGVIENQVFSLCFAKDGGSLTIGAPESDPRLRAPGKQVAWVPLVESRQQWWTVTVTSVWIGQVRMEGGVSSFATGKGTIVDSGTTDTYLPTDVQEPFKKAFKTASGQEVVGGQSYNFSPSQINALPSIFIELSGGQSNGGATIEMKPSDYLEQTGQGSGVYRMHVYCNEQDGAILGANFMRNHDVIFDEDNNRMGWVEADCHTPSVDEPEATNPTPAPTPAPTPSLSTASATTAEATTGSLSSNKDMDSTTFVTAAVCIGFLLLATALAIGYYAGKCSVRASSAQGRAPLRSQSSHHHTSDFGVHNGRQSLSRHDSIGNPLVDESARTSIVQSKNKLAEL